MVTGRLDVSRLTGLHASRGSDGRVRDGNVAGWKPGARGVAHGLWVRSGSSCRDEVGGLSGGSEHVVVRDFEDGEILQVDGEFQLPSERESSLEFASSDQASHGSVVDEEHGPEREDLVEPRNVYMSRWASDEDDVPRDTEEVSRGDRSRSMEPDCRDYSVFFSRADEDFESKLDSQVAMADDESNMSMGSPHISIDMCQGCRSVFEYERLNEIGEGTYGKVYRARDKKTGEIVALKKVKINANLDEDGFPLTALREINILSALYHPNIVNIKEVVIGDLDSVFMGMECMDLDLKGVMQVREKPFSTSNVKWLMLQLLEGVKYLHDNWVLHRDLKPSNILLNNNDELKICDFGMSRQYGSPLKPYTQLVVTLWYRAPELLLGAKNYSAAVDMWSVGCIMAELLAKTPLFTGKNEIDQLDKIFRLLGTPNEEMWHGFAALPGAKAKFEKHPHYRLRNKFPVAYIMESPPAVSGSGFDLLTKLLVYDPKKRITADDALKHCWFHEHPLPDSKELLPTFPPQCGRPRQFDGSLKAA